MTLFIPSRVRSVPGAVWLLLTVLAVSGSGSPGAEPGVVIKMGTGAPDGSSWHLICGPTAAISIVLYASISPLAVTAIPASMGVGD